MFMLLNAICVHGSDIYVDYIKPVPEFRKGGSINRQGIKGGVGPQMGAVGKL